MFKFIVSFIVGTVVLALLYCGGYGVYTAYNLYSESLPCPSVAGAVWGTLSLPESSTTVTTTDSEERGAELTDENKAGKPRPKSTRTEKPESLSGQTEFAEYTVHPDGAWVRQGYTKFSVASDGTWKFEYNGDSQRYASWLNPDGSWESQSMTYPEGTSRVNPDGSWSQSDGTWFDRINGDGIQLEVYPNGSWCYRGNATYYGGSDGKVYQYKKDWLIYRWEETDTYRFDGLLNDELKGTSSEELDKKRCHGYAEENTPGGGVIPLCPREKLKLGQKSATWGR